MDLISTHTVRLNISRSLEQGVDPYTYRSLEQGVDMGSISTHANKMSRMWQLFTLCCGNMPTPTHIHTHVHTHTHYYCFAT